MSFQLDEPTLLAPISDERPGGEDLEGGALLATLEMARLFGRLRPFDAPVDEYDRWRPPQWGEFTGAAHEALRRSKDLRVLVNAAAGLLRTEGIGAFLPTLSVASVWLETFWSETYPPADDDDVTARRNALNCFADPMAIVDGVRRLPLVSSRQHGTFSLRDLEVASGQAAPREDEPRPDEAQIAAAFASTDPGALAALHTSLTRGLKAVKQIEETMGARGGPDAVPAFEPLVTALTRIERALRGHVLPATPHADSGDATVSNADPKPTTAAAAGPIGSRQDAIRALDAVAEYFRRHEPSSPVPMLIDRAKRLVSKSFLEVLADVAPDGLPQARLVGGFREGE